MSANTHLPVRPMWQCSACDGEWPCRSARHDLRVEYEGALASLAMYLGRCFVEASGDLPTRPTQDLHARFMGWLRQVRHEAAP